jgi:hypothetical protein
MPTVTISAVGDRTDVPLKRAHFHRFSQISDTNWPTCKGIERRLRVSSCTWLTLELWLMAAFAPEAANQERHWVRSRRIL